MISSGIKPQAPSLFTFVGSTLAQFLQPDCSLSWWVLSTTQDSWSSSTDTMENHNSLITGKRKTSSISHLSKHFQILPPSSNSTRTKPLTRNGLWLEEATLEHYQLGSEPDTLTWLLPHGLHLELFNQLRISTNSISKSTAPLLRADLGAQHLFRPLPTLSLLLSKLLMLVSPLNLLIKSKTSLG